MDWNSSVLWGIIGLFGGFLTSLLFYTLGKNQNIILYNIDTDHIADNLYNQLSITYNGEDIKTLYVSTLFFKNIGFNTINRDDFANKEGLYIFSEGKIFTDIFSIPHPSLINSQYFSIRENKDNPHQFYIDFDFLQKNHFAICTIFHTDDIHLCGILKNGKIYFSKKLKL